MSNKSGVSNQVISLLLRTVTSMCSPGRKIWSQSKRMKELLATFLVPWDCSPVFCITMDLARIIGRFAARMDSSASMARHGWSPRGKIPLSSKIPIR